MILKLVQFIFVMFQYISDQDNIFSLNKRISQVKFGKFPQIL